MFKLLTRLLPSMRTPKPPLTQADLVEGLRVRFRHDVDLWPICVLKAGQTGTVSSVPPPLHGTPDELIAEVTMHEYYPSLLAWKNAVHVHPEGSEGCDGPVKPSDLEAY